jgi:mono/diheme cytochrome c family protein
MENREAGVRASRHGLLRGWLLAAACAGAALPAAAQDVTDGQRLYLQYCSSCHGASARGDGPVADVLSTRPADLTRLAQRYGSPLPVDRLAEFIDGRADVRAHGPRQMPVWGEKLYAGPRDPTLPVEKARRGTIELIVAYLQSIQAPLHPEVPR